MVSDKNPELFYAVVLPKGTKKEVRWKGGEEGRGAAVWRTAAERDPQPQPNPPRHTTQNTQHNTQHTTHNTQHAHHLTHP